MGVKSHGPMSGVNRSPFARRLLPALAVGIVVVLLLVNFPGPSTPASAATVAPAPSATAPSASSTGLPTPNPANINWASQVAPPSRVGAAFALDTKDNYDVLFGGWNGSAYLNDTWIYLGNKWIQLDPTVHPSARAGATMAYDNHDGYLVLFGGRNGQGLLGDTWMFLQGVWTQLSPTGAVPSPRAYASMAYDAASGNAYLMMFGGAGPSGSLSDTWKFVHGAWTELLSGGASSPPARSNAGMAYDVHDGYVVLFGGTSVSGSTTAYLAATWRFVGGVWTSVATSAAPSPRAEFGMVYDIAQSYVVLFGGVDLSISQDFGDTWTYSAGVWTPLTTTPHPAARYGFEAAWDQFDHYFVVAQGSLGGGPIIASDTWYLKAGLWYSLGSQPLLLAAQPAMSLFGSMTNDTADKAVLLFGGWTGLGPISETWQYYRQHWTEIFPAVSPPARAGATMTYDTADGYVVLFGGMGTGGTALGDTWTYRAGVWTQLPGPGPSPRYGSAMTYDPATGSVILFGGTNGKSVFSDTWSFSGGTWTQLAPSNSPSGRGFEGLAYDGYDHYVVLFGGLSGSTVYGDTWTFSGGTWTQLAPKVNPPAVWGAAMDFIASNNAVVLYGGCAVPSSAPISVACSSTLGETMKFYRSTWHVLTVKFAPTPTFGAANAFDALDHCLLTVGGSNGTGLNPERWTLAGTTWTQWFPVDFPVARAGAAAVYDLRDDKIVLFGGIGAGSTRSSGYLADTYEWDTGVWSPTQPARSPSARAYMSMVYDPVTKSVILFGGYGPSGYLGDTWSWSGGPLTGSWTPISTATAPSPRANASMVFDAADNEVVLFGGQGPSGAFGDTWVFSGTAWTQLSPSTSPSARAGAGIAYDANDGYVVLFGGINPGTSTTYGDTWSFLGGAWTLVLSSGGPSPRYGAAVQYAYQSARTYNFVLLFGGETATGTFLGDTWWYVHGAWQQVLVGKRATPLPSAFLAAAGDTSDGNPVLFGGYNGNSLGGFWVYR